MDNLQQKILTYYKEGMPFGDYGDVEEDVLRSFAEHAVFLRENVNWCRALPEDIFMENVAAYRINNEKIEDCRKWFFGMVWQEVGHMEPKEAVMSVNMWCAGQVTYHQASERTANAVTAYKSGLGRCGEESVFLVTVLRSVGLAARQVYAPLWSHCDDNHAWVEVWCDGKWHYLGACEPEPVLDRGWFTNAASRAMLVHARCFGEPKGGQEVISRMGPAAYLNVTHHYADTVQLSLELLDEHENPIRDMPVDLEVLNYGFYQKIATLLTDKEGRASIRTGRGEIQASCIYQGTYYYSRLLAEEDGEVKVRMRKPQEGAAGEYEFRAPIGMCSEEPSESPEWEEKLEQAKQCRQRRLLSYYDEKRAAAFPKSEEMLKKAAGNFGQVITFLETDDNPYRQALLGTLEEKDLYDLRAEVLEEHLKEGMAFAGRYPDEIFVPYLLNPRVGSEELSLYRKGLKEYLGTDVKAFGNHPADIWRKFCLQIPKAGGLDYKSLRITPLGALKAGMINEESRKILFVAVCRSLGIPARLNPICHLPEYYADGAFHMIEEEAKQSLSSKLLLKFKGKKEWKYFNAWTLSQWTGNEWKALGLEDVPVCEDKLSMEIAPGRYRLVTTVRKSDGNQLVRDIFFQIKEQEELQLEVEQHGMAYKQESKKIPLPEIMIHSEGKQESLGKYSQGKKNICIWLEEGKEPSEHILNELLESAGKAQEMKGRIFLLKKSPVKEDGTLKKVINALPGIRVCDAAEWEVSVSVARGMGVEKNKYPLAVACDEEGNGLYATAGYNVGAVQLLLERI